MNYPDQAVRKTHFGEWPYMCAILKFSPINNETQYLCGGSLIAPNVILTSAHDLHGYT